MKGCRPLPGRLLPRLQPTTSLRPHPLARACAVRPALVFALTLASALAAPPPALAQAPALPGLDAAGAPVALPVEPLVLPPEPAALPVPVIPAEPAAVALAA